MFNMIEDKNGRIWFYSDKDVWCWDPTDQTGLSGDYKDFQVDGNGSVRVKGPWCANFHALKEFTGVDLTNREYL